MGQRHGRDDDGNGHGHQVFDDEESASLFITQDDKANGRAFAEYHRNGRKGPKNGHSLYSSYWHDEIVHGSEAQALRYLRNRAKAHYAEDLKQENAQQKTLETNGDDSKVVVVGTFSAGEMAKWVVAWWTFQ